MPDQELIRAPTAPMVKDALANLRVNGVGDEPENQIKEGELVYAAPAREKRIGH